MIKNFLQYFWLKNIGISIFISVFFIVYFYLLNPKFPITIIPQTVIDDWIPLQSFTLPIYLSLWIYTTIPIMLMVNLKEIIAYGFWMFVLCATGLLIFYFFPNATPVQNYDWNQYWGFGFIKGIDAAGNACPSLHVATACFSALWLNKQLPTLCFSKAWLISSGVWSSAIIYSTLSTKQHLFIDVVAGIVLALIVAWLSRFSKYYKMDK